MPMLLICGNVTGKESLICVIKTKSQRVAKDFYIIFYIMYNEVSLLPLSQALLTLCRPMDCTAPSTFLHLYTRFLITAFGCRFYTTDLNIQSGFHYSLIY